MALLVYSVPNETRAVIVVQRCGRPAFTACYEELRAAIRTNSVAQFHRRWSTALRLASCCCSRLQTENQRIRQPSSIRAVEDATRVGARGKQPGYWLTMSGEHPRVSVDQQALERKRHCWYDLDNVKRWPRERLGV